MGRTKTGLTWALALAAIAAGCDDDDDAAGAGTLAVDVYGEAFIEEGIPAGAPGCDGCVEDGWAITFDRFLVVVQDIEVRGPQTLTGPEARVFDLTKASNGAGHPVFDRAASAGTYDALDYRVAPSSEPAVGNATTDDVALMAAEGYSIYVEGRAEKDGTTLTFKWGFDTDTRYTACETGAAVADGGTGRSQLTIHADHLLYDDLDSETPQVVFGLIASADADGDGTITPAELAAVDITGEARYQVGSRDITDLWGFVRAQTATSGHIDGEGHCDFQPVE